MPNEKEVWYLQSEQDAVEIISLKSVPERAGFILYPFSPQSNSKPYFIQIENPVRMSLDGIYQSTLSGDMIWQIKKGQSKVFSPTKEDYSKSVQKAVSEICLGNMKKVVLSRVKAIDGVVTGNPLVIFHELCIKYPSVFVSLVYIPNEITWITATPELLISYSNNKIETVSLAGTKPVSSTEKWDAKEKMEQQMVTDYINEILKKHCENIVVSGPVEVVAGNVKHLKTSFFATIDTDLWNIVSALHPTPAVCGIPLSTAKQFINQAEGYDRKYYTGFLGPCNMEGKTNLFVNLRCAELFANRVNFYVGGGITKDSVPEKEWEETELKLKTLLFAFGEN